MQGLWKEKISGYDKKGIRRRKTSRKNTIRDKRVALLKDYHKGRNKIYRIENPMELVYKGNRYVLNNEKIEKTTPIYKIGFRIPKKGFEDDYSKSSYISIKAYRNGDKGHYNTQWLEEKTDKNIRDYFGLSFKQFYCIDHIFTIKEVGIKELDWQNEVLKRNRIRRCDFNTNNQREFIYNKPLYRYYKWSMYTESTRRRFARKMVNGQTRTSVRNWINKGNWDAERVIPCYEKSYAWYID